MFKDSSLRAEIKRFTDRHITPRVLFLISQKLMKLNRDKLQKIINRAEEIQKERNQHRNPPLKRLSYKILEEVLIDDNY